MNDPKIFASGLAAAILLFFLFRFYRRHIAPGVRAGNWRRIIIGASIISLSILLSISWRYFFA